MLVFAGFSVVLLAESASAAYRRRRDVSRVVRKPGDTWEAAALVAIGALLFLIWSLLAIWIHSTDG